MIEVEALGLGIHFPRLDADFHVPALLEGVLGWKAWMIARPGAAGGRARGVRRAGKGRAREAFERPRAKTFRLGGGVDMERGVWSEPQFERRRSG
ncbi:DUF2442 domain-containing protein [Roseomonas sp. AR75]|uniref:DUF2442 domain-containing protein n=1 Tax=Roseomonas sp. AR75 TaxID=2562311 RepID=UPI0010C11BE6|nr:DUF2442 domain-containing protein [Roseomonas sp. AR75]